MEGFLPTGQKTNHLHISSVHLQASSQYDKGDKTMARILVFFFFLFFKTILGYTKFLLVGENKSPFLTIIDINTPSTLTSLEA